MEHTDDPFMALEITTDHLTEIPDYYNYLEKMENEATGKSVDPSLRPPKKWFSKMLKDLKDKGEKGNLGKIIGNIWYNQLDDKKRKEIREREGKHYGPAKALTAAGIKVIGNKIAKIDKQKALLVLKSSSK